MFILERLKEELGIGTQANYASKIQEWLGNKFILDGKAKGLPNDFYWDPDDRYVLLGAEVGEPRYQRLQCRTDDFRRDLTQGVGRMMVPVILVYTTALMILAYVAIAIFGPDLGRMSAGQIQGPAIELPFAANPREMTDEEIIAAVMKMREEGKTRETLTEADRAIFAEAQRRQL